MKAERNHMKGYAQEYRFFGRALEPGFSRKETGINLVVNTGEKVSKTINTEGWHKMKRLLAVTGVVAVLSFPGMSNADDPSVVVSANPLWTDTHLSLQIGDSATITASGSWWTAPVPPFGPDGTTGDSDKFLGPAVWGSLIAFVGSDPYQGHWGDSSFFPQATGYWNIGSSAQFTSDKTGELWLGINDDARSKNISDNGGSVTAQISIQPVPEPSACTLVLLAVALLGSRLRRRSL